MFYVLRSTLEFASKHGLKPRAWLNHLMTPDPGLRTILPFLFTDEPGADLPVLAELVESFHIVFVVLPGAL